MNPEAEKRGIDDESLLRLAAAAIHEQFLEEEKEKKEEVVFSEKEIRQGWNNIMKEYHKRKFSQTTKSFFRRAAVASAAFIAAIGGTAVTVMAISPTIRQMVLTDFGEYSTLDVLFSGHKPEIPEDWQEMYYPSYIPEGFTYKETKLTSKMKTLIYITDDGEYNLAFSIILPGSDIGLDTENMVKSEIKVKDHNAILYEKQGSLVSSILINYEDCIIDIFGPVRSEELILIAESIKTKKGV